MGYLQHRSNTVYLLFTICHDFARPDFQHAILLATLIEEGLTKLAFKQLCRNLAPDIFNTCHVSLTNIIFISYSIAGLQNYILNDPDDTSFMVVEVPAIIAARSVYQDDVY